MNSEYVASPIGLIEIRYRDAMPVALAYGISRKKPHSKAGSPFARRLAEYFSGKRVRFALIESLSGTPFEQTVWKAVAEIPYGKTMTYGEIAEQIGKPKAVRAVGRAVGKNPVPIIVPCHRVLGSGNKITGYSGGLERKRFLLALEGITYRD